MAQVPFPQFANFTAATRKALLIPFNFFSPNQETSWIAGLPASGVSLTPVNLTGTLDGVNAVFTVPGTITGGVAIYRNGVLLDPVAGANQAYTISGNTVTFNAANVPQVGDDLQALVS